MAPTLTHELLDRVQSKLKEAERALQADPTNKWLKMAVQAALDKVESIQRSLHGRWEPPAPGDHPPRRLSALALAQPAPNTKSRIALEDL
jgi:hypothetical protein